MDGICRAFAPTTEGIASAAYNRLCYCDGRNILVSLLIYSIFWFSFALAHSVLARSSVQNRLKPILGNGYRASYNVFAVLDIGLVFLYGKWNLGTGKFELLSAAPLPLLLILISITGIVLIIFSLRQYDLGRFSGITQLRIGEGDLHASSEPLNTEGLNRWVRHPLYSGAFLYLWGNASSEFGLATAVLGSLYLYIGSRYEERKLVGIYGEGYRQYQKQASAFFPWRVFSN